MNLEHSGRKLALMAAVIGSMLAVTLGACYLGPPAPLSDQAPYSDFIGAQYQVIADDLKVYGVYVPLEDKHNNKPIRYILLIPGVGIGGPEIAWEKHVPKGQVFKILSAWNQGGAYYEVNIEGIDLPVGVPVRLELMRGNEGGGEGELNPKVYRRLRP